MQQAFVAKSLHMVASTSAVQPQRKPSLYLFLRWRVVFNQCRSNYDQEYVPQESAPVATYLSGAKLCTCNCASVLPTGKQMKRHISKEERKRSKTAQFDQQFGSVQGSISGFGAVLILATCHRPRVLVRSQIS